jgi:sulfite exporter TauE/SafE
MAGSAAVLVLVVASAATAAAQAAYIVAFGLGTIGGMLSVAFVLGALVRAASQKGARLATLLHVGSAVASVVVGVWLAARMVGSLGG